jgi:ribosomal protein L16/L10AE
LQISACIKNIARDCKRKYKIWIYCFPNVSLTSKSISVRMGTGIGNIIDWIFVIKKNNIFLELIGKYKYILFKSLKNCKKKISFSTKIILGDYIKKWKDFKYFI